MLLGNFDEGRSNVRSFVRTRKGKRSVVKNYSRKKRAKRSKDKGTGSKVLRNTALGVAGVLGISAATYAGLKIRYVKNLDDIAKNLKVTKTYPPTSKSMLTFSIGGFGTAAEGTSPANQSRVISKLVGSLNKDQELVQLVHNVSVPSIPKNPAEHGVMLLSELSKPVLAGKNSASADLVQDIYNYAMSNPGKSINVASFSGGGNFSRDIDYILKKKGITAKFVTAGSTDLRFIPGDKSNFLDINSSSDVTYVLRAKGTKTVNEVDNHRPDSYYRNKKVRKLVKDFFYS